MSGNRSVHSPCVTPHSVQQRSDGRVACGPQVRDIGFKEITDLVADSYANREEKEREERILPSEAAVYKVENYEVKRYPEPYPGAIPHYIVHNNAAVEIEVQHQVYIEFIHKLWLMKNQKYIKET